MMDIAFSRPQLAESLRRVFGAWQHVQGIPRLLWWLRGLAFRARLVLVKSPDGLPFLMDREDYGQLMLYYFPYCEELQSLLRDIVRPGDICLDLGANVGLLTARMAGCVGNSGRVIAVEPNPPVFAQLRAMISQAFPGNVEAISVGIAGQEGIGNLYLPQGRFSESVEINGAEGKGSDLELTTVTSLVRRHLPGSILDFIKMDIEGNEAFLIESMQGLFEQGFHPILLVEFHAQKCEERGVKVMEVVQALFSRGYQVKHVEKHRQSYGLLEISGKPLERVNLLFVVPSHLAARPALKSSWVG